MKSFPQIEPPLNRLSKWSFTPCYLNTYSIFCYTCLVKLKRVYSSHISTKRYGKYSNHLTKINIPHCKMWQSSEELKSKFDLKGQYNFLGRRKWFRFFYCFCVNSFWNTNQYNSTLKYCYESQLITVRKTDEFVLYCFLLHS